MKQRSYCLDVLKLILSFSIAFFHFGQPIPPGSDMAVQFFFILSGFFLGQKFYSRSLSDPEKFTAWDYTLAHVKQLYPHYLFSLLAIYLYTLARALVHLVLSPSLEQVSAIFRSLYDQIPDLFLVQSSFTFHNSLNYPLWQLSALLIAGYFLYALLCWQEQFTRRLLLPAAVLMGLSLMNTGIDLWTNWGVLYIPLVRAFYPMAAGVLTSYLTRTQLYTALCCRRSLLNIASLLSLAAIFVYGDRAGAFLITVPILILACWDKSTWLSRAFQRPCFRFAGGLSYAVYLNHALVHRFTSAVLLPRLTRHGLLTAPWQQGVLFFLLLLSYSLATRALVEAWVARRAARVS